MSAEGGGSAVVERREWALEAESELRCEAEEDAVITVSLQEGNAEIFGVELTDKREYKFKGQNLAIFTWYGCRLVTVGPGAMYVSSETPMVSYVNTHAQLEARRDVALANGEAGPRVMAVGQTDSGKSTLCRILCAYAVRLGRTPVYVDLDVGQQSLAIPGCVAAVPLDVNSLSLEEGYSLNALLVMYYGHNNLATSGNLYRHYVSRLAQCVDDRLQRDADANASGVIVNTCGWVEGAGYQLLLHAIQALNIDVILVTGHDRLFADLTTTMPENITVVKLPRSGGVRQRDTRTRQAARSNRVREYYYGHPLTDRTLAPSRLEVPFTDVFIYKVGGSELSEAMLPFGQKAPLDQLQVTRVHPTSEILHSVLAVVMVEGASESAMPSEEAISGHILTANAAGFVYVEDVNRDSGCMALLSPCPGALPSPYLLLGSIKWMD